MDERLTNLADILVNYSLKVKQGEWVYLLGDVITLPLVVEIQRKVLTAGAHLEVLLNSEDLVEDMIKMGNDDQLRWLPPGLQEAAKKADALISLGAASNTRYLAGVDPARQAIRTEIMGKLSADILERGRNGEARWITTNYPCHALAQQAEMSLRDYEDFVYHATYADSPDPVEQWERIHKEQENLVRWMAGKKRLEVRGPNIDLSLSIEGRSFINASGQHNMPDGEIFTSPVEESTQGWVRFTYPSLREGRQVEGVELHFEEGRVVKATAEKNEAYMLSLLDLDEAARYLGEFAIGTNYNIQNSTGSTLYDEKIGGTVHMALGFGFEEAGGKNKSALHWDLVCGMQKDSEIYVDGELFYKDGKFQV